MTPPDNPTIDERYLGDGVYGTFDGYGITLDLRCQDASRIFLEPAVLNDLIRMARDHGMLEEP